MLWTVVVSTLLHLLLQPHVPLWLLGWGHHSSSARSETKEVGGAAVTGGESEQRPGERFSECLQQQIRINTAQTAAGPGWAGRSDCWRMFVLWRHHDQKHWQTIHRGHWVQQSHRRVAVVECDSNVILNILWLLLFIIYHYWGVNETMMCSLEKCVMIIDIYSYVPSNWTRRMRL